MSDFIDKSIKKLNIDRSEWELVNFGDVAIQQKKSVDRDTTGITKYVKGEHMNSEDLHLREWGELEDEYLGPAFIRLFDEGDILYGSRRTYLRKVTIAPFEGITSNTTFVIKPNEKRIDKRLLPFVMLSEGFAEHSIKNSKGSVNPYVNWKDIANYEFLLPPKEQQAELAELLWAMDEVIEKDLDTKESLLIVYNSISGRVFSPNVSNFRDELPFRFDFSKWESTVLSEKCLMVTDGAHASPKTSELGKPMATVENMLKDTIDVDECRKISEVDFNRLVKNDCKPEIGDVLFSKDGTIGKTFVYTQNDELVLLSSIAIIRTKPEVLNPYYCSLMFESPVFFTVVEKMKSGTALKRIVLKDIRQFPLLVPPIEEQNIISSYLLAIKINISQLDSKISASKSLLKSLINEVF